MPCFCLFVPQKETEVKFKLHAGTCSVFLLRSCITQGPLQRGDPWCCPRAASYEWKVHVGCFLHHSLVNRQEI